MLTIEDAAPGKVLPWKYNRLRLAPLSSTWTESATSESKIHRIHAYPARFPAFLVQRAFEYAESQGIEVRRVADVFCGSGTVGYEAARRNMEFWGCDINPVATLIARAKGLRLDAASFIQSAERIVSGMSTTTGTMSLSGAAVEKLGPWFDEATFTDLSKLRNAIVEVIAGPEEGIAFECAFSAILKTVSRWRSRSTKPSIDPCKPAISVADTFRRQCRTMAAGFEEARIVPQPRSEILVGSVTELSTPPDPVDLIVTSPPYAMSYEYSDLHQLSALWLGFVEDHRDLRIGAIGTSRRRANLSSAIKQLNSVGEQIVFGLYERDRNAAESAATYFLDMQKVVGRCHDFLRSGGISVFVIGNTQLSGVRIDNANHLVESLLDTGFRDVRVAKRRLSNKPNTPNRLPNGRLSSERTDMQIYGEEYIVMATRG